jgi:hypothetical protein
MRFLLADRMLAYLPILAASRSRIPVLNGQSDSRYEINPRSSVEPMTGLHALETVDE